MRWNFCSTGATRSKIISCFLLLCLPIFYGLIPSLLQQGKRFQVWNTWQTGKINSGVVPVENSGQQSLLDLMGAGGGQARRAEPPAPGEELERLRRQCRQCSLCALREGRTQVVFADGNPDTNLMLVGEGPGADEDRLGKPFVGAAGQLLNRILQAVDLAREETYITNVVKCRPPGNRAPAPNEIAACLPYLKEQIRLVNPRIIVCLGAVAAKALIGESVSITAVRGKWREIEGRLFMPTFHPAALLRDSGKKRPVWEDFKQVARQCRRLRHS